MFFWSWPRFKSGQLLIEIVLNLALLVIILGILIMFLTVFSRSQKYSTFNQSITVSGFEKYRNNLISLSQTNWGLLDSLASNTNYYIYASGNDWLIATGAEIISFGGENYYFSFKIDNYSNSLIKFVTTTAVYATLTVSDYFLLPKLNFISE